MVNSTFDILFRGKGIKYVIVTCYGLQNVISGHVVCVTSLSVLASHEGISRTSV